MVINFMRAKRSYRIKERGETFLKQNILSVKIYY